MGIIARGQLRFYQRNQLSLLGIDEEEICATRIILNKTGKSTKLVVW